MSLISKLKTFKGGIHPKEYKSLTNKMEFETIPIPQKLIIPLAQNLGNPSISLVKKNDLVKTGDIIAEQNGFVSSIIHSPVNGKVTKISNHPSVTGIPINSINIEKIDSNEINLMSILDPERISSEQIIERVKYAGIVGQGGAAFPTYVKLSPPKGKKIEHVILNGCECEPYLSRDFRLMIEKPEEIILGMQLIIKAVSATKGTVGIEDNKPEAIEMIRNAAKNYQNISVEVVKTKYPQGAEKMLIKAVTNKEVPPNKLPFDVGIVIQNIATAISVHDAIIKGMPQISASLTVSGLGIKNPKNLIVPIGTPISDILDYCGGIVQNTVRIIAGGPMMGASIYDLSTPVMKATSGILVLTEEEITHKEETNCLRCGKCVEACALNLIPTRLARLSLLDKLELAETQGITICMECGSCAYTCPANIPLAQWIRYGKQKVLSLQKERKSA
ncbi:MAG: electron transport complex subunit RsxC [Ignavibacteria bacterium]|nr:electron transport complex subunit RsxC [Ignavibacteria bacterium]